MEDDKSRDATVENIRTALGHAEGDIAAIKLGLSSLFRLLALENRQRSAEIVALLSGLQEDFAGEKHERLRETLALFEGSAVVTTDQATDERFTSDDAIKELQWFTIGVRTSLLLVVGALAHDPEISGRMTEVMGRFLDKEPSKIRPDVRRVMEEVRMSADPLTWKEPDLH